MDQILFKLKKKWKTKKNPNPTKCSNVLWIKLWGEKKDVIIEIKQIVKKPIIPWYPKLSVRKSLKKKIENKWPKPIVEIKKIDK